ncbi:50S ribosomal protein L25/general stress protein Ctc [Prosthecochloris sp. N3]|uniref:Large ribosomal subunit protein bL25 n=1 Tax=Prosthecochloris ethylica TaxID=2743976 RepID=A0ABR9XQT2_9CHLB|nr:MULTISPECIES: 50S ribosomal protein L25/general stress protein Ctc [Prosthecochloris]MBF0585498.1 50S ribosomal protein L25/general stress protein Ctc [Prosthecochloris ethylica]MBF0636284.1 50S ribosomal protein L25/general stress protein Ctc [Prosthecochloris ethylica]NUK46728.1 50S ribosomal protein L25/general stress protein Ctc [Prosthecochloris ethylica]RNA64689.1 50S ribosomal protein L25/general stress protein Ctc [Prosthecochloris sp. ZM_2]
METIVLAVEPRNCSKNEAKALRNEGKVPAVVYHKGEENMHIAVNAIALDKLVHAPESHIINLEFPDGNSRRSLLKDVQFDPVSDSVIHADFQFFAAGEVLEMEVPVTFTGKGPGIVAGGKMQALLHSLTIKGSPSNMPQQISIDTSHMELGDTMHIGEIPEEVTGGKFEFTGEPDTPIVSIAVPKKEAEETEEEAPEEPESE